ncbi:manganese efflux pump MntP family protein [Natranaerofaba carboxydovora]|uniref:manganese efflux pump MntP n=1 Tax=Natranaerofaba carboxydovora TaxID=2742683 RepID=UPI001F1293CF|nr:manganese efflux pump [Natranaerofaba carboxydovora]UMZ73462.1 Putative manganese efflux pump [Natranaerofaba carboxydovora]
MTTIIIAVAVSIDSLWVGMSYGLKKSYFSVISILLIGLCSGILMLLPMIILDFFSILFVDNYAELISGIMLVAIGIWKIFQDYYYFSQLSSKSINIYSRSISNYGKYYVSLKESLVVGIAVGLDAFGVGVAIGLIDLTFLVIPLVIFSCILFFVFGLYIGNKINLEKLTFKGIYLIPGLLLIGLGVMRFF